MLKVSVVLILSLSVLVEGVPFMKTSFDLGSKSGFCIDIESSGSKIFYDSVLLSSCKQDQAEEVQQKMRFEGTGPISIEGHKRCLEVKSKSGGWDVVFLPCSSHKKAQNFTLVKEGCMIKNDKVEYCLAAGSTVSSNGDSLTRILQVVDCNGVSGQLLSWNVHPHNFDMPLSCSKPRTGFNFPKWAAVIFVVFGLITCWCACWILFCPRICEEKQKKIGLVHWRNPPTKISYEQSDETLRCQLPTPKYEKVNVTVTSADSRIQIPSVKPHFKKVSLKQKASVVEQPRAEAPNMLTRIERNVLGSTEQAPAVKMGESSVPSTPEGPLAEIDAIPSIVRVVYGKQRRGESHTDFRSPRDYYSPRYKRRSRRYSQWSDSLSSSPWSDDTDNSPVRRSTRQRNRSTRRERYSRRRRAEYY